VVRVFRGWMVRRAGSVVREKTIGKHPLAAATRRRTLWVVRPCTAFLGEQGRSAYLKAGGCRRGGEAEDAAVQKIVGSG
jgi:hypothetical protein